MRLSSATRCGTIFSGSGFGGVTVATAFYRFSFPSARFLTLLRIVIVFLLSAIAISAQQNAPTDFDSLAQSAAAARDAGHTSDAIQFYRRAVTVRPDWAEGWWYLGTLLYDSDQFADAIPALEKVLSIAPGAPGTLNFLGLCEFENGDYRGALQHLERGYAQRSQDDPQLTRVAAYHLVLLLNRSGNFARANKILFQDLSHGAASDQIILAFGLASLHVPLLPTEVDPSKDALLQSAGRLALLVAQNEGTQAADGYPALVQQYPDVPFLHSAYASALQSAGRMNEAAAQLQLESKLHPATATAGHAIAAYYANEAARARLGPKPAGHSATSSSPAASPEQQWQLAVQLFSAGQYAEAIPPLKATIAAHPEMGTAWGMLGLAEFQTKDYENALLHLQKGSALGFGGSRDSIRSAKYALGLLMIHKGQFDQATDLLYLEAQGNSLEKQIQFALGLALLHKPVFPGEVPPAETELVQSAGEISLLLHFSKYNDAFPKLKALIQAYPDTPLLHYVYGVSLASFCEYGDAEAQFAAEARISPQSELPWVQTAFAQLSARRPADALVSAQRAVQLAPGSAEAHYVLGRSLMDSGKFEDALKELQATAQINPGSPEVHFNLAKTYAKLGRPDDAQRERDRFAQLNAAIEKQRSEHGSQAYGAAHTASELSQGAPPPGPSNP